MGDLGGLHKIFVPIYLNVHWFLIVVDLLPETNDCGNWVTQWMVLNHYWRPDKTWVVNDYSRMRLAMDLVYDEHNPKRDMIKEFPVTDWNKKMQQSVLQT
ncbi:uncharacterized protein DS421_16g532670 [Arachis hypogaea]|nr:uncharacterized protein DS421_16g532670 [Arachis hypogaea]